MVLTLTFGMVACGGGGGGSSDKSNASLSNPSLNVQGQNVLPIIVDAGPANTGTVNVPYVSVTICSPGSRTNCQTIDHIIVDTGSSGLRIMSSVLSSSLNLTQQMNTNGNAVVECLQFADGYSWGSLKSADVQLGGEQIISSLAIHVIGDPNIPAAPRSCTQLLSPENTVQLFGGNGILGVGSFQQDSGLYYACSSTTCQSTALAVANQIQNPIGLLASDNNGVVIELPSVPAAGATTASGSLILGIGTQTNNVQPSSAKVYTLDSTGSFTTVFNGQTYAGSFIDSGSNGLFFQDNGISQCTGNNSKGFYCPASTLQLTATNQGTNGNSGTVSLSVANADNLFGNTSYAAFSNLAGTAIAGGGFDWGLPFFFGRSVFTALDKSGSGGSGPYVAY